MKQYTYIFLFFLIPFLGLYAQEDTGIDKELLNKLRDMSLEDILEVKISVTSGMPLSMREAPGIVTLITREDITNSGARDLIDIFTLLVPGFDFLQSEFGPIGIGVRNIWAYEGKALILIDGMEANEEGFSGFIFGNHISPENIERIEVIRGPGSVIYGGSAGLAVINIITRKFEDKPGSYVGIQYSRMFENFSHRNISFGTGDQTNEFKYSLTGFLGEGRLSDRNYVPYFNFSDTPESGTKVKFDPFSINANMEYKGYGVKLYYESYKTEFEMPIKFNSFLSQLSKTFELDDNLSLTTTINAKLQAPWQIKNEGIYFDEGEFIDTTFANNKSQTRISFATQVQWTIMKNLHLLGGAEFLRTSVEISPIEGYYEIPYGNRNNTSDDLFLENEIAYLQLLYKLKIMNITVGGRYENTENFGDSFLPRIAFTKIHDKFHFKLMASQSFRIPGGKYYELDLKPEKGTILEFEAGYQFSKRHFMVANFYDINYNDMIGLQPNEDKTGYEYANAKVIRSRGVELEYKYITEKLRLGGNFSYSLIIDNTNELYSVPGDRKSLLGFPAVKANLFGGIKASENLSINPSVTFFGSRYGFIEGDVEQSEGSSKYPSIKNGKLKEFSPVFIVNINFQMTDIITNGLGADLGIRNLFNTDFEYIQPFSGFRAPLPAPTSSIILRIYYESNFTFF